MNRRTLSSLTIALASIVSSSSLYAAPPHIAVPVHAMFAKDKLVKFSLRNDSTAPLTLKVGSDTMTLDAGKTKTLELPVGTRIVRQTATDTDGAGTLVTQVSKELGGTTIALKG